MAARRSWPRARRSTRPIWHRREVPLVRHSSCRRRCGNAAESIKNSLEQTRHSFDLAFEEKRKKLTQGDELPAGVLKMVKVYLAVKRRLQPGDKMAGRHGNKGVVSKIVPVEDMPYMADGTTMRHRAQPAGRAFADERGSGAGSPPGLGGKGIGQRIGDMLQREAKVAELRKFLEQMYNGSRGRKEDLSQAERRRSARNGRQPVQGCAVCHAGVRRCVGEEIRAMLASWPIPDDIAKAKGLTPRARKPPV
jgi:DNA-directed RNA polymerase subunit beta